MKSAELVDHLLQDLLKSVESFHLLKQRYEDVLNEKENLQKSGGLGAEAAGE